MLALATLSLAHASARLLTLLQLVFSCGVEERLRVKGRGKPKKEK